MDVQNCAPSVRFMISRVGVRGIKKPLRIERDGKQHILSSEIDLFVDLPETQKGSHMSRNAEVISEIVDSSVRNPMGSIEDLAQTIARLLLERHEYATRAEVYISADLFLDRLTPMGNRTLEPYVIFSRAVAGRDGRERRAIGIRVIGMTACPCAMETVKGLVEEKYPELRVPEGAPFISHNQRNLVEIELEGDVPGVNAENLIVIAEASVSSPTFEILKRRGEGLVVLQAHENPRFVEDVVRTALDAILTAYPDLDGDTVVRVRSESEESIHKHTAYAERVSTLAELRIQ